MRHSIPCLRVAGAKVEGDEIRVRALLAAEHSRISRIMNQIRTFELGRSRSIAFSDKIGRLYALIVLALATGILIFLPTKEHYKCFGLNL